MWGQRPENQQKQDGAHVSDPSSWVGGGAVHPERHREVEQRLGSGC